MHAPMTIKSLHWDFLLYLQQLPDSLSGSLIEIHLTSIKTKAIKVQMGMIPIRQQKTIKGNVSLNKHFENSLTIGNQGT